MSGAYLQTNSLSKDYGNGRGAFDISITLNPGEIVGFIGPNGAGKTTTMRMIMQLLNADSGSVELFGKSIETSEDMRSVISRIGFMPGEVSFYPAMSAKDIFAYASELYGHDYMKHVKELAEKLEFDLSKQFKYMSSGNRKKLGFINALMQNPDLIILDEPTSALDPLVQQNVLSVLKQARADGKAVFLSSHTLSEVQQVCDRIIMIKDGRIIMQENTKDILARALKIFRIEGTSPELREQIQKLPGVKDVKHIGSETIVRAQDNKTVVELLVKHGIYDFFVEPSSLEDMFLSEYK